jgi:phosphinothricin acetyltransferase
MTALAPISVRPAISADVPAITRIYNQGIVDRVATLETVERDEAERGEWLAGREPRHPVIVADRDGVVVGWGSLNAFNPRPAYRHVADISVYVERAARGTGVGRALLDRLVEAARELGYHIAGAGRRFQFNPRGRRLYRRVGFREVGTLPGG